MAKSLGWRHLQLGHDAFAQFRAMLTRRARAWPVLQARHASCQEATSPLGNGVFVEPHFLGRVLDSHPLNAPQHDARSLLESRLNLLASGQGHQHVVLFGRTRQSRQNPRHGGPPLKNKVGPKFRRKVFLN